jgi:hypothetical protein
METQDQGVPSIPMRNYHAGDENTIFMSIIAPHTKSRENPLRER